MYVSAFAEAFLTERHTQEDRTLTHHVGVRIGRCKQQMQPRPTTKVGNTLIRTGRCKLRANAAEINV
jgi:hypothetical protein